MTEIINLRLVRKARARQEAAATAAENRARFGRTRGERKADEAARQALTRTVEGARREVPSPVPPEDT